MFLLDKYGNMWIIFHRCLLCVSTLLVHFVLFCNILLLLDSVPSTLFCCPLLSLLDCFILVSLFSKIFFFKTFSFNLLFPLFQSLSWIKISIFIPLSCQALSRNGSYLARKYFFVVMATIWDGKNLSPGRTDVTEFTSSHTSNPLWLLQLLPFKKWINLLQLEIVNCLHFPHSSCPI